MAQKPVRAAPELTVHSCQLLSFSILVMRPVSGASWLHRLPKMLGPFGMLSDVRTGVRGCPPNMPLRSLGLNLPLHMPVVRRTATNQIFSVLMEVVHGPAD